MISEILKVYNDLIISYEINKFHQAEKSYALVVNFELLDNHRLFAKDYLFNDATRKYSYHFQDDKGNMIFRYDNAPHWIDLENFPFHKHLPHKVIESKPMNLEKVFYEIKIYMEKLNPS
ncbi:MAG TPA: DUF6516 family protein [bacterium]